MPGSVIVGGARTPIGKLSGALKGFVHLRGIAIREALARAGVAGDQVDYVIMGHVIQAGAGQITASRSRSHQQHRPAGTLTQPGRTPERSL